MFATGIQAQDDTRDNEDERTLTRKGPNTKHYFNAEFGLSNYLKNGKFPDATNEIYTVKPFGSWSFGMTSLNRTRIAGPISIDWGANISWYNYKFQDATTRLIKDTDEAVFFTDTNGFSSYKRSKLTISYLNIFLIPMIVTDGSGKSKGFRIGAGPFAGYRIGSKTKTKFDNGKKNKDKVKSNFYLNNVRYGVRGQLGWGSTDLYFTYDMSTLFQENRGPELNPFNFGIIF